MAEPSQQSITEESLETIPTPKGDESTTMKLFHFLSPQFTSIDGHQWPVSDLPSDAFSVGDVRKMRENLRFCMWKNPPKHWKSWVLQMHELHQSVWRRAGIHDAIMNSINVIKPDEELILALVTRWCPLINTFMFPWGEITITLEDMMVLGGFSVLGESLFSSLQTEELRNTEKELITMRSDFGKSKSKKASQTLWLNKFMNSGSAREHETFLCLWLSRFVFVRAATADTVPKLVIPIAVRLARGTRIALAPGVLAGIYTNLSKLKNNYDAFTKPRNSTPLQLVQIWAWERFLTLQPTPNILGPDQPRFQKWCELKRAESNLELALENAANSFIWRPYNEQSILSSKISKEEGNQAWVLLDMDEVQDVIIRCMRVGELVGIDCIEQYLPHRVAMQFGLDQNLPCHVSRANETQTVAWENYNRPFRGGRLLVPSYLLEPNFTTHATLVCLNWWKSICNNNFKNLKRKTYKSVFSNAVAYKDYLKKTYLKSSNKSLASPPGFSPQCKASMGSSSDNDNLEVPPGFLPKHQARGGRSSNNDNLEVPPGFPPKHQASGGRSSNDDNLEVPPGFSPKHQASGGRSSHNDDPETGRKDEGDQPDLSLKIG